jgi:hypothetical protein
MQSTGLKDLLAEKSLNQGPSLENESCREIALAGALDQRAYSAMALSSREEGMATLLDNAGGLNLAGAILGTSPAEKAPGKDFFQAV